MDEQRFNLSDEPASDVSKYPDRSIARLMEEIHQLHMRIDRFDIQLGNFNHRYDAALRIIDPFQPKRKED